MNITVYPPRHVFRFTFIIFSSVLLSLFFTTIASTEESCTQLLKERCEVCHYLTRVCQKVDRESTKKRWFGSAEGTWKRTINNMVKQGAKLNENEEKILVKCLSHPTEEVLNVCNLKK